MIPRTMAADAVAVNAARAGPTWTAVLRLSRMTSRTISVMLALVSSRCVNPCAHCPNLALHWPGRGLIVHLLESFVSSAGRPAAASECRAGRMRLRLPPLNASCSCGWAGAPALFLPARPNAGFLRATANAGSKASQSFMCLPKRPDRKHRQRGMNHRSVPGCEGPRLVRFGRSLRPNMARIRPSLIRHSYVDRAPLLRVSLPLRYGLGEPTNPVPQERFPQ